MLGGGEVLIIAPKVKDIGGLTVRRALPDRARRMVGPFFLFDHMGPAVIAAGVDTDVRPHPHIGIATVTTLFEGALRHRDSLGSDQVIVPGDVNWMTAGAGIVHSERAVDADRGRERRLHGLQLWVALPTAHEQTAPAFRHYPAAALPSFDVADGAHVHLLAGAAFGRTAPVQTLSQLFYADVQLRAGATLDLSGIVHDEGALYVIAGEAALDGVALTAAQLAVLDASAQQLRAKTAVHAVIVGGAPLDGPRHAFWSFVSSSRERIAEAMERWRARGFPAIPGDDTDFDPLPDEVH